jgi:YggT family protein
MLALLSLLLLMFQLALVVRAIMDWSVALAGPTSAGSVRYKVTRGVTMITEPILAPVRRVIPPLRVGGMAIDLAFIIVFFAVVLLRSLIA